MLQQYNNSKQTSVARGATNFHTAIMPTASSSSLSPTKSQLFFLTIARILVILALALWIGGLTFFGALAAPAMFKIARAAGHGELAPQMVALMLARFGFVTYACSAFLLLGWLAEKFSGALRDRKDQIWWTVQGAASLAMLGIALYLNQTLMPQIQSLQAKLNDPASKAIFDAAHERYSSVAAIALYLGLLVLIALIWRISRLQVLAAC